MKPFIHVLLLVIPIVTEAEDISSKVFPAARVEAYSEGNGILGVLHPENFFWEVRSPPLDQRILPRAFGRFQQALLRLPDFANEYPKNPDQMDLQEIDAITVSISSANTTLAHGIDESYTIQLDDSTEGIKIAAETAFGVLHALETLAQLFEFGWLEDGKPLCVIHDFPLFLSDAPTYPFRGLLIDTSRHYLPMNLILANLDAMAMNKMNVLHWHIVDDTSFPYQMDTMPEVAEKGAFHPKLIYSRKDIELVMEEAYLRGIRVIPEVDMPGHTAAIAKSHPELMTTCSTALAPMNPTVDELFDFVREVYSNVNNLFRDEMVHVGGDEVNFACWENSTSVKHWMDEHGMKTTVELYEYFETRLLKIVQDFDKAPIVWQEVFNLNLTVTPNTIVDVWKGFDVKTIEAAVAQNFRVVLSGCWYLDHLGQTWQDFYECDPSNFTGAQDLMIGGHASMWGEHVDAGNFMSRVWPRASSVAEKLWTGTQASAKSTLFDRMTRFRCWMTQQGIPAEPARTGHCPHELPYVPPDRPQCNSEVSAF